jgi:hypothetical protein
VRAGLCLLCNVSIALSHCDVSLARVMGVQSTSKAPSSHMYDSLSLFLSLPLSISLFLKAVVDAYTQNGHVTAFSLRHISLGRIWWTIRAKIRTRSLTLAYLFSMFGFKQPLF